ncbi:MAG: hypothetical protein K9J51_02580 [Desulfotignum sp.]|nr:hypothetical protein [Desulfotignum sp.]
MKFHGPSRCFFVLIMGLALLGFSTTDPGADETTKILPVKSVPGISAPGAMAHQEVEFNGKGTIQRVGKDEVQEKIIVIDDRLMYLNPGVRYYNLKREPASSVLFHKGRRVGYLFDDKRKVTALYLIAD